MLASSRYLSANGQQDIPSIHRELSVSGREQGRRRRRKAEPNNIAQARPPFHVTGGPSRPSRGAPLTAACLECRRSAGQIDVAQSLNRANSAEQVQPGQRGTPVELGGQVHRRQSNQCVNCKNAATTQRACVTIPAPRMHRWFALPHTDLKHARRGINTPAPGSPRRRSIQQYSSDHHIRGVAALPSEQGVLIRTSLLLTCTARTRSTIRQDYNDYRSGGSISRDGEGALRISAVLPPMERRARTMRSRSLRS